MNLFRKNQSDKYGNVHFISFYSAILSRLAYMSDTHFLNHYCQIFGPVIPEKLMKSIDNVSLIEDLLEDEKIYNLLNPTQDLETYEFNGKKYIAFNSYAEKINIINKEIKGPNLSSIDTSSISSNIKYISIASSNYGEIYVLADLRMPSTIWIIFRGTYSAKTAAAYTKPTSLIPLNIATNGNIRESYLFGIYKITSEIIHTIIEAARYLAVEFLGKSTSQVKLLTTGHSLGGAMCSIFAYKWMKIRTISPYNGEDYQILKPEIGCFSLGAPRVFNQNVSEHFCNYIMEGKITYLRIITRGDPVPGMPFKTNSFSHPCSLDKTKREKVLESCNALLTMRPKPGVNYNGSLDCQNYIPRTYMANPLSHTIYLNILFTSAVDIAKFLYSSVSLKTTEISRDPKTKASICRLILYNNEYKAVFFNMDYARGKSVNDFEEEQKLENEKPVSSEQQIGGFFSKPKNFGISKPKEVFEDIYITKNSFQLLMDSSKPIQVYPLPMSGEIIIKFNKNDVSPNFSKPAIIGGKNRKGSKRRITFKRKRGKKCHTSKRKYLYH